MNKDFTTPDLCDEYGIDVEVSLGTYKSYGAVHKFYGKVETVLCPDDNSMVKEILAEEGNNRVLIINAQGISNVSMIGEIASKQPPMGGQHNCKWIYKRYRGFKNNPNWNFCQGSNPKKTEKRGLVRNLLKFILRSRYKTWHVYLCRF